MSSSVVEISQDAMTAIASHSALAGLCPLIPIPFVDDFIIVRIHRHLCRVLLKQHAIELSDAGSRTLTHSPSNLLGGIVRKLVFWPIKKLITKLVYVLAVKSCADVAATVFNEGWLLARAIEQEYVPMDLVRRGDYTTLRDLRNAVLKAREAVDPSPTEAVMRSAFSVGRGVFAATLSSLRGVLGGTDKNDERLEAAEREVAPITQRIQDEVIAHWLSGPLLDAELRKALNPQAQMT